MKLEKHYAHLLSTFCLGPLFVPCCFALRTTRPWIRSRLNWNNKKSIMIKRNPKNANKNNKHTSKDQKVHMSNKNVTKLILNKEEAPTCSVKLFECEKNTSLLVLCAYFQSSKLLYFICNKNKKQDHTK